MQLSEQEERAERLGQMRGALRQMNERLGRVEDRLEALRQEIYGELNKLRGALRQMGWKMAGGIVVAVLGSQLLQLLR